MNNNQFPFQQQPPLGYDASLENKPIFLQQPSTGIPPPNNMLFGMPQQIGIPNTTNIAGIQPQVPFNAPPHDSSSNQLNNYPILVDIMKQHQQQNPEYTQPGIELYQRNNEDRFIIRNIDENKRKSYTSNDIEMFNEIYNDLREAVRKKKSKVEQLKLLYAFQNFYNLTDEQINEFAILTGVVKPNTSKKIKEIEQNIINKYVGDFFKRYPKPDDITSSNWTKYKTTCFQDYLRNTKYLSKLNAVAIDVQKKNDIRGGDDKFKNNIYYEFDNNVLQFCPLKFIYPTNKEGDLFKYEDEDDENKNKIYIVWSRKNGFEANTKSDAYGKQVFGKLRNPKDDKETNGSVESAGDGMLSIESEIRFMDIVLNKGFKLIASNSKINLDYIRNVVSLNDGGKSLRRNFKKKTKSRPRKKSQMKKSLKKSFKKLKKHFLQKRRSMKIYQKK